MSTYHQSRINHESAYPVSTADHGSQSMLSAGLSAELCTRYKSDTLPDEGNQPDFGNARLSFDRLGTTLTCPMQGASTCSRPAVSTMMAS